MYHATFFLAQVKNFCINKLFIRTKCKRYPEDTFVMKFWTSNVHYSTIFQNVTINLFCVHIFLNNSLVKLFSYFMSCYRVFRNIS